MARESRRAPLCAAGSGSLGPTLQVLFHISGRELLRSAAKPSLDHQLLELLERDRVKPYEDGRVSVKVRRGEENVRVVGEKSLLGDQVLDPRAQDRPARRGVAEGAEVGGAERPLPDT